MIEASEMQRFEAIYSFVASDGTNTHIASKRLERWTQEHARELEVGLVACERELAQSFVREDSVAVRWCEQMLDSIKERKLTFEDFPPIIFAKDGGETEGRPDVMLVDGHHRYVVHALIGCQFIKAICLEVHQWEPFRIIGLRDQTAEQLRRAPIIKEIKDGSR